MINAVNARATLLSTRAEEPRASMRACSYHASPGPGQGNVLWIGLWMIYVNTLVKLSTAVDEGCCGKVDNRCDTGSCQVAGLPRSTGRYEVSTGEPARPPFPCCGSAQSSHGGIRGHEKVPMSLDDISYYWWDQAARWGLGWSRRCAWPGRCPGVSPVRPPATGNHGLKGLPVHGGVLFAGCPGQGGRHIASREFPGHIFHALALERPAFTLAERTGRRGRLLIQWRAKTAHGLISPEGDAGTSAPIVTSVSSTCTVNAPADFSPELCNDGAHAGSPRSRPVAEFWNPTGPAGVLNRQGLVASGAPEDRWALLGEGPQALEIVAAVVGLPAQSLDAFVHLRCNGLVVGQDAELFLDDRDGYG